MSAGAGREGKCRALPRASTASGGSRSAQTIIHDVADRIAALRAAGPPDIESNAGTSPGGGEREDRPPAGDAADRESSRLLSDAQRDLVETDALLGALTREIRVALTVIKGRAQLLRRQALSTGAPDPRLIRAVEEIDRAAVEIELLLRERVLASGPPAEGGWRRT
ncbi:MAG TPA: hypothetical protein VFQ80_13340 [Thermomicrobiales bacterium]|nr:hypothetical protein [Thermomicrobiales bacterium]